MALQIVHPLPGARITHPFGVPNAGGFPGTHTGTDYGYGGGTCGRRVVAAAAGVVRHRENAGGGHGIEIDHGGGIVTGYWHLSSRLAPDGQPVSQGQYIALVGASGAYVTGCVLHFELKVNGGNVDPHPHVAGSAQLPAPSEALGHITTYPASGCPSGYVPARIGGPLVDLPLVGATPLGSNIIQAIGKRGDPGDWNACLLASRGYRVGDDPYAPGTIPGAVGHEIAEGAAETLKAALPLLANATAVGIALVVGWSGVKQVLGVGGR